MKAFIVFLCSSLLIYFHMMILNNGSVPISITDPNPLFAIVVFTFSATIAAWFVSGIFLIGLIVKEIWNSIKK